MKLRHFNRIERMKPRLGKKGWCVCDRALVHKYQKCPACGLIGGKRDGKRNLKKDTNA